VFAQNVDPEGLRQGDILRRVPYPLLEFSQLTILSEIPSASGESKPRKHKHRDDPNWTTAQMPMRLCDCAVLNQCCDLGQKGKIRSIGLARIIRPPKVPAENAESLRSNRDPRIPPAGYISYFYLEAHPSMDDEPWVVDFSQIFSVPTSELTELHSRKVLQLDDVSRAKFKIKLATFLGRPTNEEDAAGLCNPWVQVVAVPPEPIAVEPERREPSGEG